MEVSDRSLPIPVRNLRNVKVSTETSIHDLDCLSECNPLKEKAKPVTLPFEKLLMDLEKKIMDLLRIEEELGNQTKYAGENWRLL